MTSEISDTNIYAYEKAFTDLVSPDTAQYVLPVNDTTSVLPTAQVLPIEAPVKKTNWLLIAAAGAGAWYLLNKKKAAVRGVDNDLLLVGAGIIALVLVSKSEAAPLLVVDSQPYYEQYAPTIRSEFLRY